MKERKTWIDGLRGLAMLFVIYGHLCMGIPYYSIFSSPIKLPLFFAVTGYVFSFKGGDMRAFFSGLWKHLIRPWLIFAVLYTIVKIAAGTAAGEALYEFASGNVAWYIPCLIAAEIIFFLILKAAKSLYLQYLLMLAVSVTGYFLSRLPGDFWTFAGRMMIVQFYILTGYAIRNLDGRIEKARLWPAAFGLIFIAAGAYLAASGDLTRMDVQSNYYTHPLICAAMALCGCSFLFYYARFVKTPRWLAFIGRNTLIFYLFHARILDMLRPLINKIPYSLRSSTLTGLPISLAILVLLCGICAICSLLIDRYVPVLAGKSRKK